MFVLNKCVNYFCPWLLLYSKWSSFLGWRKFIIIKLLPKQVHKPLTMLQPGKEKKNSSYFLGNEIDKTDPTNNTSLNFCERTQEYNLRPRHNQPLLVKSVKQCWYPCSGKSIDRQNENGIFKGPITVPSQIPLHRWRPRTRILALIFRQT